LLQTKFGGHRSTKRSVKPHERVLANVRGPRSLLVAGMPDFTYEMALALTPGLGEPVTVPEITEPGRIGSAGTAPQLNSFVLIQAPSSGRANGSSGGSSASVPEPTTWLTMIFGMGLAGVSLRRSNARRAAKAGMAQNS
jgi:hypothetical protein